MLFISFDVSVGIYEINVFGQWTLLLLLELLCAVGMYCVLISWLAVLAVGD